MQERWELTREQERGQSLQKVLDEEKRMFAINIEKEKANVQKAKVVYYIYFGFV